MTETLDGPVINGPFDAPERYVEIGPSGPTGVLLPGRRPSESWIPVPAPRKGNASAATQETLDFDVTGERRERNDLINEIRREVERMAALSYAGVTPITRKLLQHWADQHRENRVFFCQREAAETAIFLAEVAGATTAYADWRRRARARERGSTTTGSHGSR